MLARIEPPVFAHAVTTTDFPNGEPSLPRRVLHVMNAASGGAAMSTVGLMNSLSGQGIESVVVCHDMGSTADRQAIVDATRGRVLFTPLYWMNRKIRSPLWKRPLLELRQLAATRWSRRSTALVKEFATRHSVELIHTNTILTPEGGFAARALGLPHVWHVRELLGPGKPFRLTREGNSLGRFLELHASRVVCNSFVTADQIRDWLPPDLLTVVRNGINVNQFTPPTRPQDRVPVVVAMVASLRSRWKKHAVFIEAAAKVDATLPIQFQIYGDDPVREGVRDPYAEELHQMVDRLGLSGRWSWMGHISGPAGIMSDIDVLVHSADHESFGRIIVEAMAAGRPVVAARGGGAAEIVIDGITGLLADADSPEQLARHIELLARDAQLRFTLGQAGREEAVQHYSAQSSMQGMLSVYREAMQTPAGATVQLDAYRQATPTSSRRHSPSPSGRLEIVHFISKRWEEFERYGFRKTSGKMFECLAQDPRIERHWFVQSDRRLGWRLRHRRISDKIHLLGLPNGERANWSPLTRRLNCWLLRRHLESVRRDDLDRVYWYYDWMGAHLIAGLPPGTTVMELTDEIDDLFSTQPDMLQRVAELKRTAVEMTDIAFAVAPQLAEQLADVPQVAVISNAIGAQFLRMARIPYSEPVELTGMAKPRLGVVGTPWSLNHRLDHQLLAAVMKQLPDWQLVLIGCDQPAHALSELVALPNVHLFGMQHQLELATFIQHFDVCAVPYRAGPVRGDALKTYEYLACHKPVVLTVDYVAPPLDQFTRKAPTAEAFATACRQLLTTSLDVEALDRLLEGWTWEQRAVRCLDTVIEVTHAQRRQHSPTKQLG